MRRPAGTGFCCPMISLTLVTAFGVSETGGVFFTSGFTSGTLVFTSGTVVVAIRISLALKSLNYSRGSKAAIGVCSAIPPAPIYFDAFVLRKIPADDTCQRVYNARVRLPSGFGLRGQCCIPEFGGR